MISEVIKKRVPVRFKAYIKMGTERKQFARRISEIESEKNDYDLLLGTAIHTNLGDHLITLAEEKMMGDLNPNRKVYEVPTEMFQFYKKRLRRAVNSSARIFINGGGWMGNLWPNEERLLQDMVDTFCENETVIFPQTVYYDYNVQPFQELIDRGNRIFKKCADLTLFVRDKQSYDFAKKNLSIKKIMLVPDIGLYYSPVKYLKKEGVIGLCVREDREKSSDSIFITKLCDEMILRGYQVVSLSTMYEKRVPSTQRFEVCEQKISEFSKCTAVITDRLHGMIFSYLSGTACVILDNKTKKVSGVYEQWLSKSNQIYPAYINSSIDSILQFIQNTRGLTEDRLELTEQFIPVIAEVKHGRD